MEDKDSAANPSSGAGSSLADYVRPEEDTNSNQRYDELKGRMHSRRLLLAPADAAKKSMRRALEAIYKQKLRTVEEASEKKDQQINELSRKNAMLRMELDSAKKDADQQLHDARSRYQEKIAKITQNLDRAQQVVTDSRRDAESIRRLEKESDEYKQQWMDSQRELSSAQTECDKLRKSVAEFQHSRELFETQERETAAATEAEIALTQEKLRQMAEKYSSETRRAEELDARVRRIEEENAGLRQQLQARELEGETYRRQLAELGETLKDRQIEVDACMEQVRAEGNATAQTDLADRQALQCEIERLTNALQDARDTRQDSLDILGAQLDASEKHRRVLQEEHQALQRKLAALQTSYENLKHRYFAAANENEKHQSEILTLRTSRRGSLTKTQELVQCKDHLEVSLRVLQEENQRLLEEKSSWEVEREKLQQQVTELIRKVEMVANGSAEQVKKYIRKASAYKSKARQGDLKLQQMSARLVEAEAFPSLAGGETVREGLSEEVLRAQYSSTPEARQLEAEIASTLEKSSTAAGELRFQQL